ncbi:MAG: glycosyltransferase family 2 protein, partial [Pirellulaceae bacterium]|nr:glycosyltransferase family 2 protein [Pirellulaceae bacterium]
TMINAQIIDSTSSNDVMLQEIMSRIEGVEELVASELNTYRNASAEQEQACLTTIVIPVYNEIDTVARVVSRVAALPIDKEILIVDDCSTDGTVEILKKLEDVEGIKLILKSENEGKGAALRTGFDHDKGDIVVIQDADLE